MSLVVSEVILLFVMGEPSHRLMTLRDLRDSKIAPGTKKSYSSGLKQIIKWLHISLIRQMREMLNGFDSLEMIASYEEN